MWKEVAAMSALKVEEVTLLKCFSAYIRQKGKHFKLHLLQLPPCLCSLNVLTVVSGCNGVI